MHMGYRFDIHHQDTQTSARRGVIMLSRGEVPTPVFMPVGTNACVKTLDARDLLELDAPIILSNTYHNYVRPGDELIAKHGGLHAFMKWPKPILTDSGGFQIFSLSTLRKLSDEGVRFQSHVDGTAFFWTPEDVIKIQKNLFSDIIMPLDVCTALPAKQSELREAMERSLLWLDASLRVPLHEHQSIHGIVQGGTSEDLRAESARRTIERKCDGYSIGGLSVGEEQSAMMDMVELCDGILPKDKPRYLMGVGTPLDLVLAVARGVDMFDCVMPTRNARNGTVFTTLGKIHIKNARFKEDMSPMDPKCSCYTCKTFSASYLHHLFKASEPTVMRLLTIHNLHYYQQLTRRMQDAISSQGFAAFVKAFRDSPEAG